MRFRNFFSKNGKWIALIIVIAILALVCNYVAESGNAWIRKIFIAVCILSLIVMISVKIIKRRTEKNEEIVMEELKDDYKNTINLVNSVVKKVLEEYGNQLLAGYYIDTKTNYLAEFAYLLEEEESRRETLDSFTIATCLLYSLLDYPIITLAYDENDNSILSGFELDIALKSAYELISKPIIYHLRNGEWIGSEYDKVDIVIPDGIIENEKLYQRIRATIYNDEITDQRASIEQLSNLFHLIYLNCQ